MKVILCSVPKSGTYLVANFLEELKFVNSNFHLNDNEYSDYTGATIESGRKNPELYRKELDFCTAVDKIKDNEFAVGHFSVHNKSCLKDFKKIFLYRNLTDCAISFGIWTKKTGRWYKSENNHEWRTIPNGENFMPSFLETHGNAINNLFSKTVPWYNEESVLKIKYENLTGENGRDAQVSEFKHLAEHLNIELETKDLECKISNCLNKNSLTKIKSKKNYGFYKDKRFKLYCEKSGLSDLNNLLGYSRKKRSFFEILGFSKTLSFYDLYWKRNKVNNNWQYGINIVDNLIDNYKFKSVLDAGCGSGDVVRYFINQGYDAKGIELSQGVLKDYAKDLLRKGIVKQGTLTNLPFKDNEFDVVFSSEVLEHIHEEDIPKVVSEFVRVSKSLIFMTISLRPSSNFNRYHINLKPRQWWEDKFMEHNLENDLEMISNLQKKKDNATVKELMELGPTKTHINEMEWFTENPPYDLKGELEPWYFIFKKL